MLSVSMSASHGYLTGRQAFRISLIRMSRSASEAYLMEQEAAYRWREWRKIKDRTQRENFVEGHFLKNFAQSEISVAVGQCRT